MADQPPLANLITLGAHDFPGLRDFYRRLGWPQIMDDGEFAVFELRGILLALFPIAQLARDGNTEPEPSTGGIRFTIGVIVDTAEEVDRLTDQMRQAGARITKAPVAAEFFAGRSAYLCDPRVTTSRSPGPSPAIRSWRRPGASPDPDHSAPSLAGPQADRSRLSVSRSLNGHLSGLSLEDRQRTSRCLS